MLLCSDTGLQPSDGGMTARRLHSVSLQTVCVADNRLPLHSVPCPCPCPLHPPCTWLEPSSQGEEAAAWQQLQQAERAAEDLQHEHELHMQLIAGDREGGALRLQADGAQVADKVVGVAAAGDLDSSEV